MLKYSQQNLSLQSNQRKQFSSVISNDNSEDDEAQEYQYNIQHYKKQSAPKQGNASRWILLILSIFFLIWISFVAFKYYRLFNEQVRINQNQNMENQMLSDKMTKMQKDLQAILIMKNSKIQQLTKLNTIISSGTSLPSQNSLSILKKIDPVSPEQFKFKVPKFVWFFQIKQDKYLIQRSFENVKWYAKQSGFQLRVLSSSTYQQWLSKQANQELKVSIANLQSLRGNFPQLNSKFQTCKQILIELMILRELGGVFIKFPYIFTQKLDWLQNIKSQLVVNTGNPNAIPKVFYFYSVRDGSDSQKANIKTKYQAQKYIVKYPGLAGFLIAATPKSEFIKDLSNQYFQFIQNPNGINDIVAKYQVVKGAINTADLNMALTLASLTVLAKKQQVLDQSKILFQDKYSTYAIDEYGVFSINNYYYPDKMWYYFNNRLRYFDSFFNYVAKLPQDEFEDSIGPLRYIANFDPHGEFTRRIQNARDGTGFTIVKGSFIERHLFMDKQYPFIKENKQNRNKSRSTKKWDSLPKILWLFWDSGFERASATNQLCMLNLIRNAEKGGFKVNNVNEANALQFMSKQEFDKINNAFNTAQIRKSAQAKSDLYRLSLISTFGGIYLDASYFFLQDFNWITEISNEPIQFFFNRFGDNPKVVMQFHPIEGGPFDWTVDEQANTKVQWHLAYESNFLAADKGSEFIKEWYDLFVFFLNSTYDVTEKKMRECDIYNYKWTNQYDRYLTVMDSVKCVLGCRQKDIDANKQKYGAIKHANDYYKLWAFNGFTGIQKFRFYNNYANSYANLMNEDNVLLYRVSQQQAEMVYGPIFKTIKLYGNNIRYLNMFMERNRGNNFTLEAHPDSIFVKYLFNNQQQQLFITDGLHAKNKK